MGLILRGGDNSDIVARLKRNIAIAGYRRSHDANIPAGGQRDMVAAKLGALLVSSVILLDGMGRGAGEQVFRRGGFFVVTVIACRGAGDIDIASGVKRQIAGRVYAGGLRIDILPRPDTQIPAAAQAADSTAAGMALTVIAGLAAAAGQQVGIVSRRQGHFAGGNIGNCSYTYCFTHE